MTEAAQKSKFKQFITHPKFKLWLSIMGIVVIVAVSLMSLVMVLIPVNHGLNISIANVSYIQVYNSTIAVSHKDGRKANYRAQDDASVNTDVERDSVQVATIKSILNEINGAKTKSNRFRTVFLGQGGNEYAANSKDSSKNVSSSSDIKNTNVSNGLWIRIVFKNPQYRAWREGSTYHFEKYDGTDTTVAKETLVTSLYFPLGDVSNKFTQQTWYLGLGYNSSGNASDTITTKFVTYGNYNALADLVIGLTSSSF